MKRTFDFLCALLGLLTLSPLLAAIAIAVWAEDRHSPFFLGRRMAQQKQNREARYFRMVKFRTMVPDAWKSGVSSTANGDRRITRVGQWLRKAKLDELPQLWNVLVGDMSLVGPRPQVETDASLYTAVEQRMLSVRPGVTDLASIVFSDEGSILAGAADADLSYNQLVRPWKSRLALLYIDRGSVVSDLKVIWLTLIGAASRERALIGVAQLLWSWNADPLLQRMARRHEPLIPWPPPGATEIVASYPKPEGKFPNPEQARTATTLA